MNAITWYYSFLVNHAKRSQISAFHNFPVTLFQATLPIGLVLGLRITV
jgi:hypothetical protein